MKRLYLPCLTVALVLLPRAIPAQSQSAVSPKKAAESKPNEKPAAEEAAKPASEPVKSAAFADVDRDGHVDLVLAYDLLAKDVLATAGGEAGAFLGVVARIDDTGIGASLSPVSETLQTQLKLTKGQGLVVTSVSGDSLAAKAGLQVDDILLSAGDRPLAKPSDVSDIVNAPVKKPFTVEFTVLRGGERRRVPLTVADDVTAGRLLSALAVRHLEAPTYRVGVEVSDASSTLRAQLKLPTDQGIVIDRVLPDTPAQKAGFQAHDVLLTVNGKPLTKSEDLSAAVKASEGKALKFELMRGGQKMEITATPEKRDETAYRTRVRLDAQDALLRDYAGLLRVNKERAVLSDWIVRQRQPSGDTAAQIEKMLKQIDDLRDAVKALQGAVAKQQQSPPKPAPPKPAPPVSPPVKVDPPKH
jgi:membrane-associated protease RseP (regulator of RpoE activity)